MERGAEKSRSPRRRGNEGAPEPLGDRGAYMVEYLVVLVLVSIVAGISITTLGVPLVGLHLSIQSAITAPVP